MVFFDHELCGEDFKVTMLLRNFHHFTFFAKDLLARLVVTIQMLFGLLTLYQIIENQNWNKVRKYEKQNTLNFVERFMKTHTSTNSNYDIDHPIFTFKELLYVWWDSQAQKRWKWKRMEYATIYNQSIWRFYQRRNQVVEFPDSRIVIVVRIHSK